MAMLARTTGILYNCILLMTWVQKTFIKTHQGTTVRHPQQPRSSNVGSMLGQRRRRWANIEPILGERLVFSGSPAEHIHNNGLDYQIHQNKHKTTSSKSYMTRLLNLPSLWSGCGG